MATMEAVLRQRMTGIKKIINIGLKTVMGQEIKDTIIFYIENNFYGQGYSNKGQLAKSLDVKVEMEDVNRFIIQVYFRDDKIKHTSLYGSDSLGINKGDIVYTAQWINDGFTYVKGSRTQRLKDIGLAPQYMENAIKDLEQDKSWIGKFHDYLRSNGINIENI